jgi:hypothetical protein
MRALFQKSGSAVLDHVQSLFAVIASVNLPLTNKKDRLRAIMMIEYL